MERPTEDPDPSLLAALWRALTCREEALAAVPPETWRTYLRERGWARDPERGGEWWKKRPGGCPVPLEGLRKWWAVERVAEEEGSEPSLILARLLERGAR